MEAEVQIPKTGKTDRIKMVAKLLLGLLLVAYVLQSRMIDFSALASVVLDPANIAIGFGFLALSAICSAARWYLLVRAQGLSLSFRSVISLTMIGNFFNTFMPGAVGGDLIKAWYVAGREPQRKTRAIFTVLLDRAIGMSVIIFYAASTLALYRHWINGNSKLQWLAWLLWGFTLSVWFGIAIFYSTSGLRNPLVQRLRKLLDRVPVIARLFDATFQYHDRGSTIAAAVVLSLISILGMNLLYYLLGEALHIEMELAQYFFVVPVALTATAVPLLPGGIGVGQVAFYTLFQWIGSKNPEQGATLCTLLQVYTIFFNFTGIFFYLRFKRRPHEDRSHSRKGRDYDIGIAAHAPA